MKVVLYDRHGGAFEYDMPRLDEVPPVAIVGDRVFREDLSRRDDAAEKLVYIETIALRLELPAGAGL